MTAVGSVVLTEAVTLRSEGKTLSATLHGSMSNAPYAGELCRQLLDFVALGLPTCPRARP